MQALAKRSWALSLSLCRAGKGALPETQEGLHRENGGDPEPVEEHRGPVCELVSHQGDTSGLRLGRGTKRATVRQPGRASLLPSWT